MSRRDLSARLEDEVSDFKIHDLNNWVDGTVADSKRAASIETRSSKSQDSNKHKRKLTYGTVANSTANGGIPSQG